MLYRFAELTVRSELPLPELPTTGSGEADCVIIRASADPAGLPNSRWDHHWRSPDGVVALSCARDGDTYRLGMPELATFVITADGSTVTCRSHGALPAGTLEHLLIDQVLPRVLTHRGRLVLHAGCVDTPHGAVAFLGDSGAGKSTLCAEFARAGHPLLGDDGLMVRPATGGGFEAMATYAGLRLLPGPLDALFAGRAGGPPVAHYTAKRRLDRRGADLTLETGPRPLVALYALQERPEIETSRLPEREAFLALLKASFQLHLDDEERSRGHFERLSALLDGVPVRGLAYPREFVRLSEVRTAVLGDLAGIPIPASSAGCACS
jgi:hypothetical protein